MRNVNNTMLNLIVYVCNGVSLPFKNNILYPSVSSTFTCIFVLLIRDDAQSLFFSSVTTSNLTFMTLATIFIKKFLRLTLYSGCFCDLQIFAAMCLQFFFLNPISLTNMYQNEAFVFPSRMPSLCSIPIPLNNNPPYQYLMMHDL